MGRRSVRAAAGGREQRSRVDGLAGLAGPVADLHDRTAAFARRQVVTGGPVVPFAVTVDLAGGVEVVEVPHDVTVSPDLHLVAMLADRRAGLHAVCVVDDVRRDEGMALRLRLEDRDGNATTVWHGHETELDGTVTWVAISREPGVRSVWA